MGLQLSPVVASGGSGGGGGGFTSPMANDTYLGGYLTDGTTIEDLIGVSSGDAVTGGSLKRGLQAVWASSDNATYSTYFAADGNDITLNQTDNNTELVQYRLSAFPFEESLKIETGSNLPNGLASQIRILSQASADGNVIYQQEISANSDLQNEVQYYMQRFIQTIATDGSESLTTFWRAINEGNQEDIMGINKNRFGTYKMPNFYAEAVTGGVGFFQVETSLASGNFRAFVGAGTAVPADASANVFAASSIFTDADATVDTVARTYINQGTDSNARFRAIATYTAAGQLMTPLTNSQLMIYAGTVSLPGLTFNGGGSNTGFYSLSTNSINITIAGTERWRFNSNSLRGVAGAAASPNFTTILDADTGMWLATGHTGFAIDGVELFRTTATGLSLGNNSAASAWIHVQKTSEQLRLGYDASNYNSFTVGTAGELLVTRNGTNTFIYSDASSTIVGDVDQIGDGIALELKTGTGVAVLGDYGLAQNGTRFSVNDVTQNVLVSDSSSDVVELNTQTASNFTLGLKTRFSTAPMAGANPTNAELVTAFGPATGMQGYIGILDANADETDIYIVTVGGANDYWYVKFTQAA